MKKLLLCLLTIAICWSLFACNHSSNLEETTTSEEITTPEKPSQETTIAEETTAKPTEEEIKKELALALRQRLYGEQECIYYVPDVETLLSDFEWACYDHSQKPSLTELAAMTNEEILSKYGELRDGRGLAILLLRFEINGWFLIPTSNDPTIVLAGIRVDNPACERKITIAYTFYSTHKIDKPFTVIFGSFSEITGIECSPQTEVSMVEYWKKWVYAYGSDGAIEIPKHSCLGTNAEMLERLQFDLWGAMSYGPSRAKITLPEYPLKNGHGSYPD